ncbi:MAG: EAL domain-containing protein [Nitrospira sp.]|nr:EAL domain-containing protein [Nitrospira sp.]
MAIPLRVLIVEDSEDDAVLLSRELRRGGYELTYERVDTAAAMIAALKNQTWDIVFSDHSMPHFSGTEALAILRERGLDLPFIFVSGTIGEDNAVAAMKVGAHDYIMKGNLKRLIPAVDRELREAKVRKERTQAEETIRHLAYYDPLTNFPNRTLLHDRLQQAIVDAQGGYKQVALLLMDLDRFKEINDTLGHHRGDILLKNVGLRIQGVLRASDMIARLGGDEFAVLLPSVDHKEPVLVARKITKILEFPFDIEGLPIDVEASIGIVLYPDHGSDADSLIQRADVAMYAAKQTGSGYTIYTADQDQHSPRRLALMAELRHAIEEGQLLLHYQPKVNLATGSVSSVEVLGRWPHEELGAVPPDQFIPLAERTGLIKPLTGWVLDQALNQCRTWYQAGIELSVAVNLSVRNLLNPQLPDQVAELLQHHGISPDCLELEITESSIMADPERAREIVTRLNKMGIQLSIDDFGTGYSSLGYLKRLPVHWIKIDKSFVIHMMANESDAVIVQSTIDLAHNLGLKVVAEGVENQGIYDRLVDLGCDTMQGYYISPPLPADELVRWLRESRWGLKKTA